ncbi:efflux RND transporter permease subunit [Candidatus Fermentibacteria bacterium]|nr:efflux RND transporter permease subunit [Candidatus Fermentibacteria bacterium]
MLISRLSVRRPVFMTMLTAAFVLLGAYSYRRLVIDLMPNVEFPVVMITSIYPGAGPEEMETQVTQKIEDAVSTMSDIDRIESYSRESVSFVIVQFKLEVNANEAANDVRAKVDAILSGLPSGVEKPKVQKFEIGAFPIVSLSVSSDRPVNETYAVADRLIRDRLVQVSGVANVDIIGGQRREIQVAADRRKLEHYGLPISAITGAIAAENLNIPQGRIVQREREYMVRTVGEFASLEEIGTIKIPLGEHGFIPLRDLADIRDTYEECRSVARFNGTPAVQVDIIKQSGANTVATADGIYKAVDDLRRELPEGFEIEYADDNSTFIRDAVKDVQQNMLIGIVLTSILLYLFLRNVRVTVVAAIVMPAAIVATFLLVEASGFTLNILTLMALGISVGILVTNSIVVLENIIRHLDLGEPPDEAAIKGTDEIALAVFASVMTNIVVFVPVAFMRGIIGRFFLQFGMTVVYATLFSVVVSFTLTPMLASIVLKRVRRPGEGHSPQGDKGDLHMAARLVDRMMVHLASQYRTALAWALARGRNRVILGAVTILMLVFSFVLLAFSGGEFMPRMDQGTVTINLKLPAGTSLAQTDRLVAEVEARLAEEPNVASVLSTVGGSDKGVNEAVVLGKLVPASKRRISDHGLANQLRATFAGLPGATVSVSSSQGVGHSTSDLEIEVLGWETEPLRAVAAEVELIVAATPGVVDVQSSWEPGAQELRFIPNREELSRRGLSTAAVAMLLRNAYEGDDQAVFRDAGEEYAIRVQYDDADRGDVAGLSALRLPLGPDRLPLTQLGEIQERRGESEIQRRDRQRRITVAANLAGGTVSEAVRAIQARTDALSLPAGYRIRFAGSYEMQEESFASLFETMGMAVILTYVVLAMILESFIHPVTVMITLPLGLIGAAIALFFGGQTVNILSLMAMIMLVGIVVNNAILLLDYVAVRRRDGLSMNEAILDACPVKLRPIVMTNLAIAVGMIPQALGGAGSEFRVAMAVVTIGGVLISAVFTLFLIPALYASFETWVERLRARRKG